MKGVVEILPARERLFKSRVVTRPDALSHVTPSQWQQSVPGCHAASLEVDLKDCLRLKSAEHCDWSVESPSEKSKMRVKMRRRRMGGR